MRDYQAFAKEHEEELLTLIRELAVIPAPSHHEEKRAEYCLAWLHKNVSRDAYIDDAKNVICILGDPSKPAVLLMAHTDIVFDESIPLKVTEQDGKLFCPGIGDDTAHVAMILLCAKYTAMNPPKDTRIIFCANSCEEGQGNLKGCRALMERFGKELSQMITFDGYRELLNVKAVGSSRYRIVVDTEGGHSLWNFGNANAIAVMAELISALQQIPLPKEDITTFNFGNISGGTTVNSIAQHCELLYEFRSDNAENLAYMKENFNSVIEKFKERYQVTVTSIGERPCGKNVDPKAQQALIERVESVLKEITEPKRTSGSTDANLPLSMGIPAVCPGFIQGDKLHTTEEYVVKDSLAPGLRAALKLTDSYL